MHNNHVHNEVITKAQNFISTPLVTWLPSLSLSGFSFLKPSAEDGGNEIVTNIDFISDLGGFPGSPPTAQDSTRQGGTATATLCSAGSKMGNSIFLA